MNTLSPLFRKLSKTTSSVISFFKKLIRFTTSLLRFVLGSDRAGLYIYPHSQSRSFHLRLPTHLLFLLSIVFFLGLSATTYLSIQNLLLTYFEHRTSEANLNKKSLVVDYQTLIKNYIVTHTEKKKQVESTVAIPFNSSKKGVGGGSEDFDQSQLLFDYNRYQSSPENWDNYFSQFSDQEFIDFVDQHLENLEPVYSMIDKFEIRLNRQKKVSKSMPTSWPVRFLHQVNPENNDLSDESKQELQTSLQKNSQGISVEEGTLAIDSVLSLVDDEKTAPHTLTIDINQAMAVVSTSRGIVDDVQEKEGLWRVVVKHEYGFSTYYEGLDSVQVKPGDMVNRLAQLGTIGTASPKLKYQIKIASKFTNPRDFLIFNY